MNPVGHDFPAKTSLAKMVPELPQRVTAMSGINTPDHDNLQLGTVKRPKLISMKNCGRKPEFKMPFL